MYVTIKQWTTTYIVLSASTTVLLEPSRAGGSWGRLLPATTLERLRRRRSYDQDGNRTKKTEVIPFGGVDETTCVYNIDGPNMVPPVAFGSANNRLMNGRS